MKKQQRNISSLTAKQYYTIGEVAEMIGVSIELLRKWERDFPRAIKPMRTKGDTRLYSRRDIEKIEMIYRLRHNEGKTIAGVRSTLSQKQTEEEIKQEVISRLSSLRQELQGIVEQLNQL
ncbi:MAG: MerR family transcriptional regulator [Bacteroidales bacterium]|nr:MerR family transcriptional regulator [Candidatus Liminaster caballi]